MNKLYLKVRRLYYVFFLMISEPYYIFFRKKIMNLIWNDWFKNQQNWKYFQKKALKKVIQSALNTEYYGNLQKQRKLPTNPTLGDFPIISKVEIKNEPLNFLNKNKFIPYSQFNTGGSTGEPFKFYNSFFSRHLEYAHQHFFYKRVGLNLKDKIASFDGVKILEKKKDENIFWVKRFKNFPFGSLRLSATHLTKENAKFYVQILIKEKPYFLRGYPSAIALISEYIIEEGIQQLFYFVKGVMLTSENIDKTQLSLVKSAFSCPILPQYGMTETCAFGFTKPDTLQYYCSPYYGVTEVLNNENCHVEKGEIGEIVLTSLGNRYQPFIRYRTGDMAQYGGELNGFVILQKIIGRTQDFIIDSNSNKIMLVGLIFGAHTQVFGAIKMWQIIQNIKGEIEVRIDVFENWNGEYEKELRNILSCNNKINVSFIFTNKFELTKAGKIKFVIQSVK